MLLEKSVFQPKILSPLYSSGNSPNTITLSYSVEYLTHLTFCESVLGVNHMTYTEDFAHSRKLEQFKIKMRLKQRKTT